MGCNELDVQVLFSDKDRQKNEDKRNVNNVQKAKNQSNLNLSYFKKLFIPSATRSG